MKRLLPLLLPLLFLLLSAALLVPMICERAGTGWIDIAVRSGTTDEPLPDAVVVIPESGGTYRLDALGHTGPIPLPVLRDARFRRIHPVPWGEVTLLVYCDGYYPYALFHAAVRAGETRSGPTVHLFPDDGSMTEPFALVESPDTDWTRALIEAFRPGD